MIPANVPKRIIKGGVLLKVAIRCNHCNKERLPGDIAAGGEGRGFLCVWCLQNHHRNLLALAGARPRACNECGVSFDRLAEENPFAVMTVQLKDGVLQLLCKPCARRYERKTHLYKNTEYGHRTGIHAGVK